MTLTERTLASLPPAAEAARDAHRAASHDPPLCRDAGDAYAPGGAVVAAWGDTAHLRPRGEEAAARKARQQARRWVVERPHCWLNRF